MGGVYLFEDQLGWRLCWSLRTCLSTAIAVALTLAFIWNRDDESDTTFKYSFAAFVCIMVKDHTIGATLRNGVACIVGSAFSSLICWIILVVFLPIHTRPLFLFLVLILSFCFQYIEFYGVGKKLAVSLLVVHLLIRNPSTSEILTYMWSILIGVACSLCGLFIPYPYWVSKELDAVGLDCAKGISSLLSEIMQSWKFIARNPGSNEIKSAPKSNNIVLKDRLLKFQHSISTFNSIVIRPLVSKKRWSKIKNFFLAVRSFRSAAKDNLATGISLRWDASVSSLVASCQVRAQLLSFIQDNIDRMRSWSDESRFGQLKSARIERYHLCLNFLSNILIGLCAINEHLDEMQDSRTTDGVVHLLNCRPEFRRRLHDLVRCMGITIQAAAKWMQQNNFSHMRFVEMREYLDKLRICIYNLDNEFFNAQRDLYHAAEITGTRKMIASNLIQMNRFLCILDSMTSNIIKFCENAEINLLRFKSEGNFFSIALYTIETIKLMISDIFPQQKLLFSFNLNETMRRRLKTSLCVSLSICLAGAYGLYVQDSYTASFTVAYIAGGDIAGAHVITSFNRGIGTVVACIFSIFIIELSLGMSQLASAILIGIFVVGFQLPATYMRTFPFYGYSGTVAGFTVALLLLVPEPSTTDGENRVIDTFIGIFIFIIIRIVVDYCFPEDSMLSVLQEAISNIKNHFVAFRGDFQTEADLRKDSLIDKIDDKPPMQTKLSFELFTVNLQRQHDLIRFIRKEPVIFRPPQLTTVLVDELLLLEKRFHQNILILTWVLEFLNQNFDYIRLSSKNQTNSNELTSIAMTNLNEDGDNFHKESFFHLLLPVQTELQHIESYVISSCEYMNKIIADIKMKSNRISFCQSRNVSFEYLLEDGLASQEAIFDCLTDISEVQSSLFEKHAAVIAQIFMNKYNEFSITSNSEVKIVSSVFGCVTDVADTIRKMQNIIKEIFAHRLIQLKYPNGV